jgi:hypothetical protein
MKRGNADDEVEQVPAATHSAVSFKRFDFAKLHPTDFSASNGNYGGFNGKARYGAQHGPVLVTGPAMKVLFEPSVWDEEKQLKWGKGGGTLDADRKLDKWSLDLEVDDTAFEAFLEAYIAHRAKEVHAAQERFLPLGAKQLSIDVIASKFYSIVKTTRNGVKKIGFDGRCDVGAQNVPLILEDEHGNRIDGGIGKGARVHPVMDLSRERVADKLQSIKQYVEPIKFIVRREAYVPPSLPVDAKAVKADIDD